MLGWAGQLCGPGSTTGLTETDWASVSVGLDWVQARDGRMTRPSLDIGVLRSSLGIEHSSLAKNSISVTQKVIVFHVSHWRNVLFLLALN